MIWKKVHVKSLTIIINLFYFPNVSSEQSHFSKYIMNVIADLHFLLIYMYLQFVYEKLTLINLLYMFDKTKISKYFKIIAKYLKCLE